MTLQPAPILFPDIELWATAHLRTALTGRSEPYTQGVFVSNAVPATRRDRMVIVRRDGGAASGVLDRPRLSVRVWAKTEQDATDLARLVAALLWAAPDGAPVVAVAQLSGAVAVPDESGQPLRFQTFELTTRGEAIS